MAKSSRFFHDEIFKLLPAALHLLGAEDAVAPLFKERPRGAAGVGGEGACAGRLFQGIAEGAGRPAPLEFPAHIQPVEVAGGGVKVPETGQPASDLGHQGDVGLKGSVPCGQVGAAAGRPGLELGGGVVRSADGVHRLVKQVGEGGAVLRAVGAEGGRAAAPLRQGPERRQPGVCLGAAAEGDDLGGMGAAGQCAEDQGPLVPGKVGDPLVELGVQRFLYPGHILPHLAHPVGDGVQADFGGVVQEKHRVAGGQPLGEGAAVVAVDDPGRPRQPFRQHPVKFLPGDVGAVGFVPEPVQVVQGQAGDIPQAAGKGALARPRTANDQNFLHGSVLSLALSVSLRSPVSPHAAERAKTAASRNACRRVGCVFSAIPCRRGYPLPWEPCCSWR